MIYTLREARKGTGKRESIIEWFYSNPSELTFENYKNSKFWVEQPKSSWTSTVSLLRRGQLKNQKIQKKEDKLEKIKQAPRGKNEILHGKLTETWGAAAYFQIEGFTVSYLKEKSGNPSVFEADFNYVDLDLLSKMLTHNSVDEVADYLMENSNMNLKVTSKYPLGKDCGDLQDIIFTVKGYLENNTLTFTRL